MRFRDNLSRKNRDKSVDVEALSDEFFAKYKTYYEGFVKYITGKCFKKIGGKWKEVSDGVPNEEIYVQFNHDDKAVRDYVKKLLGRLVFLHFLQKKGWLGASAGTWADGDRAFLLHLFENASPEQKDDFLDGVLERLFFNALNADRSSQGDFFTTGVRGVGKCRIPYLNGGLFERDELDKLRVKFPAEMFKKLLNFFAEYNFTIDENDPNEAEVGIDPEMLGRIFENLLEDNKDKGAFYTPKAIVGYMCRQSLLAYLTEGKTEKDAAAIETFLNTRDASPLPTALAGSLAQKLRDVKICDPAIGSGAFPMGLLRELFACRAALGDPDADNPAALKRSIIENNIYGVDIEKGAVDIARLRFWLSLVVDETEPLPLPNLDFRIMQGNSLVESWQGHDLSRLVEQKTKVVETVNIPGLPARPSRLTLFENATDINRNQLHKLQHQWYSCSNHNERKRIRDAIRSAAEDQVRSIWPDFSFGDLDPSANMKFFLWHLWFSEVFDQGGFDIVIGNPPYVSTKGRSDEDKTILKQVYGFADDLYYHFIIRGFELLKPRGIQSLITSDTYFTIATKEGLRDLILGNELIRLVHWGQEIFDAMVSTATFISRKAKPESDYQSVIIDMKGRTSLADGAVYTIRQDEYRHSINRAFYIPSELNVKINERFASQQSKLIKKWWGLIKTSRDIAKNERELQCYRKTLQCGDLTLAGLVTDGGQGLATGDNGRYVGVRKGTKAAAKVLLARPKKLEEFNRKNQTTYTLPTEELAIWDLFDWIKEKY